MNFIVDYLTQDGVMPPERLPPSFRVVEGDAEPPAQSNWATGSSSLVEIQDDLYAIHNDFVPGSSTALIADKGVVLPDGKFSVDHDNILTSRTGVLTA